MNKFYSKLVAVPLIIFSAFSIISPTVARAESDNSKSGENKFLSSLSSLGSLLGDLSLLIGKINKDQPGNEARLAKFDERINNLSSRLQNTASNNKTDRHDGDETAVKKHYNPAADRPWTPEDQRTQTPQSIRSISDGGFVSINFDDGYLSAFERARPIVKAAGFPSTHYLVSRQLGDNGFDGYITSDQIRQLAGEGNEVTGHTRSHEHLTELDEDDARTEILGAREDLTNLGITPSLTFAYPYGEFNDEAAAIVRSTELIGARGTGDGLNYKDTDPFELRADSLDRTTSIDHVKNMIDEAIEQNGWYIITLHEIDNPDEFYSVSPELVQQIVDYLKEKDIPVVTNERGIREFINGEKVTAQTNDINEISAEMNRVDSRLWKTGKIEVNGNIRYTFSDQFQSNTVNDLDARFFFDDNRTVDLHLKRFPISNGWQNAEINFAAPAGAKAMVIYHVAELGGQLDVRNSQLTQP